MGEQCKVLFDILHMDGNFIRVFFVMGSSALHNGIKNGLFAGKVVVERGCLDANGLCNFPHADGIIPL